jgi:hypothetical protein
MLVEMSEIKEKSKDLESMLFDIAANNIFVYVSKDCLRYKNYQIVKQQGIWQATVEHNGYNKLLGETLLKISAFAICKAHEKKKSRLTKDIVRLDKDFEKNYNDSLFYKNTYTKTNNLELKDTVLWRYEISHAKAKQAKQSIDNEFYSLLR